MCNRLFLIFTVIIYAQSFSQTSRLDYLVYTKNTVDTTGIKTYLLFNQSESLFIWNSENSNKDGEVKTDNDDLKVKLVYNDTVGLRVLNKYRNNDIKINESFWGNNYIISEPKGIIWDLQNEKKKIGSLTCQKAVTRFRGRDYTAWFTINIPIPAGPWKLNGLPGLILEAYDDKREVNFLFKSIHYNVKPQEKLDIVNSSDKLISLKDFVIKKDSIANARRENVKSRLPRGITVVRVDSNKRNGIELIYEWEENKE